MPPWLGKVVEAVYDTKPLENRDPFKIWCQPWCICDRLNVESSRLKMKQQTTYKRNLPIFHINSKNIDGWWFFQRNSLSQENFHFFDVFLLDKMQNIEWIQFLPNCFRIRLDFSWIIQKPKTSYYLKLHFVISKNLDFWKISKHFEKLFSFSQILNTSALLARPQSEYVKG